MTCKTCGDRRTVTYIADTCQSERQGPCPSCAGIPVAAKPTTETVTDDRLERLGIDSTQRLRALFDANPEQLHFTLPRIVVQLLLQDSEMLGQERLASPKPTIVEASGMVERLTERWPDDWKRYGFNHALTQAARALRYLADNDRPWGGEQFPNSACCHQIAAELERTQQVFAASLSASSPSSERGRG